MINGARDAVRLAHRNPMFMWGMREGLKYGALVGVIGGLFLGASIPTIVFILIAR